MRKPAKRRSLGSRLLRSFFTSASVLAIAAGDFIVRNPVLTGGATAFLVVMSFVSANALWYQPEAHNAVFFRTRPDFVFKPTPRAVLPGTAASDSVPKSTGTASVEPVNNEAAPTLEAASLSADRLNMSASVDDMLPALAPNADLEIARLQQRLSTLGVYKGPVDGFTGPQTREAVERWRALQQKLGVQEANIPAQLRAGVQNSVPAQDEVAKAIEVAVPTPRPQPAVLKTETDSKPKPALASYEKPAPKKQVAVTPAVQSGKVTSQDIIRVQAGLKAFGNDTVPVTGQPGKTTQEAVREFQKLFSMPVTGEIDATLIAKMREIGLIS
ncbi:peptidoglycan-binding protein [Ochrobactrum pecoris]|uniref:Peptidoglycan hydrolase-like protein with peptidoglycan-binding domain n=1 Tax=Brucella pecoris TaxID=867683 RepID=A0A5C5CTT0_9HYPH|nr:peptidoglycan-binding domain-containing protein [Brucella pecoris]MBB4093032.1 peptidoglycan hydrolase-like protein with peptidoglycan-binding domain [Brucella pecoris]NKW80811.1 peptidoglycan-binding protein [Brucella pecoris]TNV14822.1 peptidoglycan-binding protein [Brucella pecoris]